MSIDRKLRFWHPALTALLLVVAFASTLAGGDGVTTLLLFAVALANVAIVITNWRRRIRGIGTTAPPRPRARQPRA